MILKEPLTGEQEEYYIKKKEEGDLKAKEKLIEHNLRLVVFLAKKYENTGVDLEDLVSIGNIGLIKGINTFSSDKNIKLATYCSRCIDNEILMYLRKNKKLKLEVSIDCPLSLDGDGNELHLEDIIGRDKDIVPNNIEEKNNREIMLKCINNLKQRDKEIMVLRYGLLGSDEYTYKEVDETHGGIRFKSPREIPCMFEIKESEIKSYDNKTANGIYSVSGNFEGIVLCRTLEKYHCDIKRGDYIAVQIDTDRKAYFVVTNDGKINTANANYIGAYKTAYRKIEATATTVNEFNGR